MLAMYSGEIGSFSSRDLLLFFHHVGIRINSSLSTSIHVGRKETSLLIFLLMGVLGVGLYGSNEPTLNFETSVNQSYHVALEIIFYWIFNCFCCKIADSTPTYMVTRSWRGTLQYFYDRIRLVYLDEMGGVAIPMPKIFTLFSSFSIVVFPWLPLHYRV
ncbi:putative NADH:ubiquinone oxidoreductase [Helianthus anomalus]